MAEVWQHCLPVPQTRMFSVPLIFLSGVFKLDLKLLQIVPTDKADTLSYDSHGCSLQK